MLQKYSFKEKIIILLALILAIYIGYYFILYSPLQEEYSYLEDEKELARTEYQETTSLIEEIPQLEERVAELEQEMAEFEATAYLQKPEDVITFLSLGYLGERLELKNYEPQEADNGTYIYLNLTAEFHSLLEFIIQIYSGSPQIAIEELYSHNSEDELVVELTIYIDD